MPINLQHLSQQLGSMGVRNDANDTIFFARQLELVEAKAYDTRYPEFKARRLFAVNNEGGPWVDTVTYKMFDSVGKAKVIANHSQDPPLVGVSGKEYTNKVHTWGDAYEYTVEDLEKSAHIGMPLDDLGAKAARRAMEEAFDEYTAIGNAALGVKGALNHASIPLVVLPHVGAFDTLTPQQMLTNLHYLAGAVNTATKEIFPPDTLVVDPETFQVINSTTLGTDSDMMTVSRAFLGSTTFIKNIESWHRATGAGVGGANRILVYQRNREIAEMREPMPFQSLPPQAVNYSFRVPCRARFGGLTIRYPKAMAYADVAQ